MAKLRTRKVFYVPLGDILVELEDCFNTIEKYDSEIVYEQQLQSDILSLGVIT
jgi:hypothetical protein